MKKLDRPKFIERKILIDGETRRDLAVNALLNLPIYADEPLECVIRERVKGRKLDQNSLMWVNQLKCIAEQAWSNGHQYSAEIWHEYFKKENLPDPDDPEFDITHVKDGYTKFAIAPDGSRVLIGSTTQLTVKGFAIYLQKMEATGAICGVQFSENPKLHSLRYK